MLVCMMLIKKVEIALCNINKDILQLNVQLVLRGKILSRQIDSWKTPCSHYSVFGFMELSSLTSSEVTDRHHGDPHRPEVSVYCHKIMNSSPWLASMLNKSASV
jgi:hypothetical protein